MSDKSSLNEPKNNYSHKVDNELFLNAKKSQETRLSLLKLKLEESNLSENKKNIISLIKKNAYGILMSFGIFNHQYKGYPINFKNIFEFDIKDLYSLDAFNLEKINLYLQKNQEKINNKIKQELRKIENQENENKNKIAQFLSININEVDEKLLIIETLLKKLYKNHINNIFDSFGEGSQIGFNDENDIKYDDYGLYYLDVSNIKELDFYDQYSQSIPNPIFTDEKLNYFDKLAKLKFLSDNYPQIYKALLSGNFSNLELVFNNIIKQNKEKADLINEAQEKNKEVLEFLKSLSGEKLGYPEIEIIVDDNRVSIGKKGTRSTFFTIPKYNYENGKIIISNNPENVDYISGKKDFKIFQIRKLILQYIKHQKTK